MAVNHDIGMTAGKLGAPRTKRDVALLSVGGMAAGLAAAACCLIPFALSLAGIGGAWIGNLTALEPYRFYFASFGIACIGYGFYLVYRKPAKACAENSYCAQPRSGRIARIGIWIAMVIVVILIASPYLIAYWP
jgi:mercuric ion transport protein